MKIYSAPQKHTRTMFERIRDLPMNAHSRVRVEYGSSWVWGLSSNIRKTVRMDEAGEFEAVTRNVVILADAFDPMPRDNDEINVGGKDYTVADSHYDSVGATVKIVLVDLDAR